jgi:polyribonucleotide nucleotidyltransferase
MSLSRVVQKKKKKKRNKSSSNSNKMEGPCGIVTSKAAIDWSERRSVPVHVTVSEKAEASGHIPQTFRRREGYG